RPLVRALYRGRSPDPGRPAASQDGQARDLREHAGQGREHPPGPPRPIRGGVREGHQGPARTAVRDQRRRLVRAGDRGHVHRTGRGGMKLVLNWWVIAAVVVWSAFVVTVTAAPRAGT